MSTDTPKTPKPKPRTIPPWTLMPCDQCGCEYQASRTQPITASRFFCGDCEVWEKATTEAEARSAARIAELEAENTRLLAAQVPRPVPEGEVPTKPGWYRVKWKSEDEDYDCVYVVDRNKDGVYVVDRNKDGVLLIDGAMSDHPLRMYWWGPRIDDLTARIEALEAENARLMACVKAAGLVGLTFAVEPPDLRAAQSTPRPTVDSGAPSGLDESEPPPGWVRTPMGNVIKTLVGKFDNPMAWAVYYSEAQPAIRSATATLVAERDALAEQVRAVEPLVAAVREHMRWDWLHLLDDTVHSRDVCEDVRRIDIALAEYDRLFPAGPRAERGQADG